MKLPSKPVNEMDILPATVADIPFLTQVEIESKLQSAPECFDPIEIDYPTRFSRWQTYFNAQSPLSAKPERIVFKAVFEQKLIGYISGHLTNRHGKDAEIQSFYILKDSQRKGLGKALLGHFLEWLARHKAKSLCVGIAYNNPYQAFYLKYGGTYLNKHWIYWDDLSMLANKIKETV
jgi:GNAT superfamily N-acetyltransferase